MKYLSLVFTTIFMLILTASCQQDIDRAPQVEDAQVKVEAGMSVPPYYSSALTQRQPMEVTQSAGTAASFRGIDNLKLLPFGGNDLPEGASSPAAHAINLGGIAKGELTSMKHFKFFEDKALNLGVSHAVVYGKAVNAEGGDAINGALIAPDLSQINPNTTELNALQFNLKPIADNNLTDYKAKLKTIINYIIDAQIQVDYYFTIEGGFVKKIDSPVPLLWKNLVGEQEVGEGDTKIDLDDEKLRILFEGFRELKSGSAASILETVKSLYKVLGTYTLGKHAIEWKEDGAGGYLIKNLAASDDPADTDGFIPAEPSYTKLVIDLSGMKTDINERIETYFDVVNDEVIAYKVGKKPADIILPDGALPIEYYNGEFVYDHGNAIMPSDKIKINNICYPASLYYMVNSPLRARATKLQDGEKMQVNTATAWSTAITAGGLWGSDKTGDEKDWQTNVKYNTRAVVLTENIHYAVALLETSVRTSAAVLQDNNKKDMTPDPNMIAVPASGFPVTGILVGGQPDRVGWDFHAVTTAPENFLPSEGNTDSPVGAITSYTQTIYDNGGYAPKGGTYPITAKYSTSTYSEAMHTLCLESQAWGPKVDGNRPSAFYVALELLNTSGTSFVGADGIVPAGGKFYLLAKLDLETDPTNGITNVTGSGIGSTLTHVLQKGYKTKAELTIASLKNAYNTIPDLRLTKIAFGLSVNLEWQQGAIFNL